MQIPKEIQDRLILRTRPTEDADTVYPSEVELKHEPKQCDDCERVVVNRRTAIKQYETPQPHWRNVCLTCKKVKHPETGKYTLTDKQAVTVFRHRIARKK
jgi:hypothetical protein